MQMVVVQSGNQSAASGFENVVSRLREKPLTHFDDSPFPQAHVPNLSGDFCLDN
jgi:hypothetical protein